MIAVGRTLPKVAGELEGSGRAHRVTDEALRVVDVNTGVRGVAEDGAHRGCIRRLVARRRRGGVGAHDDRSSLRLEAGESRSAPRMQAFWPSLRWAAPKSESRRS